MILIPPHSFSVIRPVLLPHRAAPQFSGRKGKSSEWGPWTAPVIILGGALGFVGLVRPLLPISSAVQAPTIQISERPADRSGLGNVSPLDANNNAVSALTPANIATVQQRHVDLPKELLGVQNTSPMSLKCPDGGEVHFVLEYQAILDMKSPRQEVKKDVEAAMQSVIQQTDGQTLLKMDGKALSGEVVSQYKTFMQDQVIDTALWQLCQHLDLSNPEPLTVSDQLNQFLLGHTSRPDIDQIVNTLKERGVRIATVDLLGFQKIAPAAPAPSLPQPPL